MDYDFSKTLDKNIIFYSIYNTESEVQDESDVLYKVRRSFFESGRRMKNRDTIKTVDSTFRYSFTIENGKILKWKKLMGNQQVERVIETADGYYVESLDFAKRPIKKTYYNYFHIWQKSEFYSLSDRIVPIYVLTPSFENNSPVMIRTKQKGYTDILYPFNVPLDKSLTEKLNIISGEPQIFCRTSQGDFYFCTKAELEERKNSLNKMIQRDSYTNENKSDSADESAKEPSAFVINSEKLTEDKKDNFFDLSKSDEVRISSENNKKISGEELILKLDEIIQENKDDSKVETKKISESNDGKLNPVTMEESRIELSNDNDDKTEENSNISEKYNCEAEIESLSTSFIYEQGEIPPERETTCVFASDCPYETIQKQIIESGGKQYFYFGELSNNKRNGRGRTAMKSGETAYEGNYINDKRDGFGVYYYKSGKLCYAGNWKNNKRNGLGSAFSPLDGSVYIGEWKDDLSVGVGASFDYKGKLMYLGKLQNGKKDGAGITFDENKNTFFVGKYKDGSFLGTGTQFSSDGTMLYTGEYKGNMRCGTGTSYNADGTVKYSGRWFNNVYDGEGVLNLENGGRLTGNFKNGKAFGKGTITDKNERVIYVGSFVDDIYNGTGRLFSDDGAYAEGRFVDGEPTGVFNEYNSDGKLIYSGEWNDMRRNGRGIEYKNGEKIYEGGFVNSEYCGDGKQFKDNKLIYTGAFSNGKRNGFGVEFKNDKMVYQGMWSNDAYGGSGIVYENGNAKFAGVFSDGKRNGRINEISNNRVIRKCLYKDDELIYMCEYGKENSLLYYGSVKDNQRNGMGCSFIPYCEKQFEGIFKNGEPEKPMKVFLKELSELPECRELENTEYELYRKTPEYIIEKNISGGIFTGRLKNGKPDGKGTILYSDHRYTGVFSDGEPDGEGVIYMRDGKEIKGFFRSEPFEGCETIILANITYYKINL